MKFKIEVDIELSNGISEDMAKTTLNTMTEQIRNHAQDCWLQPLSVNVALTMPEGRVHA